MMYEPRLVLDVLAVFAESQNAVDVFVCQPVVVRDLHALFARIHEEYRIVALALLHHHDAGRDGRSEKEVVWQLYDGVNVVVVHEILAYLLLGTAAIHYAREAYNRRGAVRREKRQRVHYEREVGLGLGGEHSCRREARIVDERRVAVAVPAYRVWRIRDYHLERLVVPMLRRGQRIAKGDVELVVADVVQEHVYPAEVVGRYVYLLAEEAEANVVLAEHLRRLEKKRPGTASGVVHLVDLPLVADRKARKKFAHLLWREELSA